MSGRYSFETSMSQSVNIPDNGTYRIKFWFKVAWTGGFNSTSAFDVFVGVTQIKDYELSGGVSGYTESVTYDMVLPSGSVTIDFTSAGETNSVDDLVYVYVDNVSIKRIS